MDFDSEGCAGCFTILLIVAIILSSVWMNYSNKQEFTATVTKEVIDDGDTFFALEKDDGEKLVVENEDAWLYGKLNSQDVLMDIEIGQTYEFTTIGIRSRFLSKYPNIIEYELVETTE